MLKLVCYYKLSLTDKNLTSKIFLVIFPIFPVIFPEKLPEKYNSYFSGNFTITNPDTVFGLQLKQELIRSKTGSY